MKKPTKMVSLRLKAPESYWSWQHCSVKDVENEIERQTQRLYDFMYKKVPVLIVRKAIQRIKERHPDLMP